MLQPFIRSDRDLGGESTAIREDRSADHGGIGGIDERLSTDDDKASMAPGITLRFVDPIDFSSPHSFYVR